MNLTEKKIDGKSIYKGRILNLEVDEVLLPDGQTSERECVRHCGGVAVLYVKDGRILLVKQFRYLYGREIFELPAGKIDAGENECSAAYRELAEETGFIAEKIAPFLKIYPSPGYTDEVIHIFIAQCCKKGSQKLDNGEFLSCVFMPVEKVLQMIESGEICDAKTVAAVYKYLNILNK